MATKEYGDAELWKHFLAEDESACSEVYHRFYPLLYSYGVRLVCNNNLVEDTIQNLFVKLIQNRSNLRAVDNVRSYLLCAFRNKLFDCLQSSRSTVPIDNYEDIFPVDKDIVERLFDKDDVDVLNERRLANAIAQLSGRQREVLYLYYVKELSHREIAQILGMGTQSSKNLLSRTISQLRIFFFSVYTILVFHYLSQSTAFWSTLKTTSIFF